MTTASAPKPMRPIPIIATILVALAIATMIALGVWQLGRKGEKEAQLAQLSANLQLPAITYPELGPVEDALLFRKSRVTCLSVVKWAAEAGKASDGSTGFRYIADCATGAEGPGARVVLGVGNRPDLKPAWTGGVIDGWIVPQREESGALARALGHDVPNGIMLVADKGQAGLKTVAIPTVDSVANNHLAYAGQWFLFALAAAVIYGFALRRRWRTRKPAA